MTNVYFGDANEYHFDTIIEAEFIHDIDSDAISAIGQIIEKTVVRVEELYESMWIGKITNIEITSTKIKIVFRYPTDNSPEIPERYRGFERDSSRSMVDFMLYLFAKIHQGYSLKGPTCPPFPPKYEDIFEVYPP